MINGLLHTHTHTLSSNKLLNYSILYSNSFTLTNIPYNFTFRVRLGFALFSGTKNRTSNQIHTPNSHPTHSYDKSHSRRTHHNHIYTYIAIHGRVNATQHDECSARNNHNKHNINKHWCVLPRHQNTRRAFPYHLGALAVCVLFAA